MKPPTSRNRARVFGSRANTLMMVRRISIFMWTSVPWLPCKRLSNVPVKKNEKYNIHNFSLVLKKKLSFEWIENENISKSGVFLTVLVENESYIYSPELGVVYMGGGAGRLPGRDVFYPGFKNCLYGRLDRTFFILGLKTVYMGGGTGRFLSWF